MTARLYPSAFGQLQSGSLDWESLSVKGILVSAGFTYDSSLVYRDELNEAVVIAESEVMTSPTQNGNVVTGNPIEWLQLLDNRDAYGVILYDDTGDDPYSPLISYHSAESVEGLPTSMDGSNFYLYPVQPPGGYFSFVPNSNILGAINTYSLAYQLALADSIGGTIYSIPTLVFGYALDVSERICLLPDVVDSDQCCEPTIRSSLCE